MNEPCEIYSLLYVNLENPRLRTVFICCPPLFSATYIELKNVSIILMKYLASKGNLFQLQVT